MFETTVLGRHRVTYSRCTVCASLQSETPYWLEEAYESALVGSDTGAVSRCLSCQAAISVIGKVMHLEGRFVDYGGGAGLLCRLLRDIGFDAYTFDKYADPVYARAFAIASEDLAGDPPALISAIEVFEHCADPGIEIGKLFEAGPQALFATTVPYRGEGVDWWYIGAGYGQHIFFYSPKALRMIAERYSYYYVGVGDFHVFSRKPLRLLQRAALKLGLSRVGRRFASTWMAATRTSRFSNSDFRAVSARSPQEFRKSQ